MKTKVAAFAVALMSVMFANVATAQTTKVQSNEKPVAAKFADGEAEKYISYMSTHDAKQMGLSELDFQLFVELFKSNNEPIYTSVEEGGLVAGRKYAAGDSLGIYIIREGILKLFSYPIRTNEKEAAAAANQDAKIKLAAARAWAVEELNEGRPRHRSEIVADLSNGETVTIPTNGHDIYGWSVIADGTYQAGDNRHAFGGEFGIRYTINLDKNANWFIGGQGMGSFRKSFLNANAVDAGDSYISYGTAFDALIGRSFGKHHQFKLALVAGLNWEFYKTDSQARYYADGSWDELQSTGNYLSSEFMLHAEYEGYNWPVSLFVEGGVRQFVSVWQNEDGIRRFDPQFRLGVTVPVFRHWTNNR